MGSPGVANPHIFYASVRQMHQSAPAGNNGMRDWRGALPLSRRIGEGDQKPAALYFISAIFTGRCSRR